MWTLPSWLRALNQRAVKNAAASVAAMRTEQVVLDRKLQTIGRPPRRAVPEAKAG